MKRTKRKKGKQKEKRDGKEKVRVRKIPKEWKETLHTFTRQEFSLGVKRKFVDTFWVRDYTYFRQITFTTVVPLSLHTWRAFGVHKHTFFLITRRRTLTTLPFIVDRTPFRVVVTEDYKKIQEQLTIQVDKEDKDIRVTERTFWDTREVTRLTVTVWLTFKCVHVVTETGQAH